LLEPFPIEWDQQRSDWFGAAEGRRLMKAGLTIASISSIIRD